MIGAGGPGGLRLPWGKAESGSNNAGDAATIVQRRRSLFMVLRLFFKPVGEVGMITCPIYKRIHETVLHEVFPAVAVEL